jgi:hypothetical protein
MMTSSPCSTQIGQLAELVLRLEGANLAHRNLPKSMLLSLWNRKTRGRLFPFWMSRLSKPKAFPAPVFLNEFDTGSLQSGADSFDSSRRNLPTSFLEVDDR